MSTYWKTGNFEQPTDEELKKNQAASRKREAMRGHVLEPVVVTNARGDICTSWWGKAWCRNLESYADYSNRLERGKRYLREGSVIDLKIARGKVTAKVQGSRKTPYRVEIRISPLSEEKIDAIMQQCGHKLDSLEKLTTGELPEDMRELFLGQNGLFPSSVRSAFPARARTGPSCASMWPRRSTGWGSVLTRSRFFSSSFAASIPISSSR